MGIDPRKLDDPNTTPPGEKELAENTFCAYADLDASPTKAWMVHHRVDPEVRSAFDLGFGKRPAEELYDLRRDPDALRNRAADPAFSEVREWLRGQLFAELRAKEDPRVTEMSCRFERPRTRAPSRRKNRFLPSGPAGCRRASESWLPSS